jgi:hypothetical protein
MSQNSSQRISKKSKRSKQLSKRSSHDGEVINGDDDEEEDGEPEHPEVIIERLEEQLKKFQAKFPINKFSINSANSFKHLIYKAEDKGETQKVNKDHLYKKFTKAHKQMNQAHQLISTKIVEEYHNLEELREREAEAELDSDEETSMGSESDVEAQ